jgi:hypothetical protein
MGVIHSAAKGARSAQEMRDHVVAPPPNEEADPALANTWFRYGVVPTPEEAALDAMNQAEVDVTDNKELLKSETDLRTKETQLLAMRKDPDAELKRMKLDLTMEGDRLQQDRDAAQHALQGVKDTGPEADRRRASLKREIADLDGRLEINVSRASALTRTTAPQALAKLEKDTAELREGLAQKKYEVAQTELRKLTEKSNDKKTTPQEKAKLAKKIDKLRVRVNNAKANLPPAGKAARKAAPPPNKPSPFIERLKNLDAAGAHLTYLRTQLRLDPDNKQHALDIIALENQLKPMSAAADAAKISRRLQPFPQHSSVHQRAVFSIDHPTVAGRPYLDPTHAVELPFDIAGMIAAYPKKQS